MQFCQTLQPVFTATQESIPKSLLRSGPSQLHPDAIYSLYSTQEAEDMANTVKLLNKVMAAISQGGINESKKLLYS
jgi:hypothetical protein